MKFNVAQKFEFNPQTGETDVYVLDNGRLVKALWAALPGSQAAFLAAPELIVLYQGTRGGCGKTVALLMDFLQFVGIGLGAEHSGVLLKRSFPELEEVEKLSEIWIPKLFPGARPNWQDHKWKFATGETLRFGFFTNSSDVEEFRRYQGRNTTWCGLDEAANWPDLQVMNLMLSVLRTGSLNPNVVRHMRLTTNTYGVGRDSLMEYFQLSTHWQHPTCAGPLIRGTFDENGNPQPERRAILGRITENVPLMYASPGYMDNLTAGIDPAQATAWREAIWTAPPSAAFGHVNFNYVRLPWFTVPAHLIDRIRIGYDYGDEKPYSFLFFLEWDGSDIVLDDGTVIADIKKGSTIILDEIYGGIKNKGLKETIEKQAARVHAKIIKNGWDPRITRRSGNIADASIFGDTPGYSERSSIAGNFLKAGIAFEPANKNRMQGVKEMSKQLLGAAPGRNGVRENPGLFFTDRCEQLFAHIPHLQLDPKNPEDIDTKQLDHDADALRYILMREKRRAMRSFRRDGW